MDKIAVLDFGGQYAHLIANRIRRIGVYSDLFDGEIDAEKLREYKGIILSGGPQSVHAEGSLQCDHEVFKLGIPILGLCYGHQIIGHVLGGKVEPGKVREYGKASVKISNKTGIFEGFCEEGNEMQDVWMSHFDQVTVAPSNFEITAFTNDCPIAAMQNFERKIFGIQFHPEVTHTKNGMKILENFVKITGAAREWSIDKFIENEIAAISEKVGNKKVFMMVSGGVDSTVAFTLLEKALGNERVYGLFVDTGFLRKGEREQVEGIFKTIGATNVKIEDASGEYFEALKGVYDPEKKRQIIGSKFLEVQRRVFSEMGLNTDEWILGQGTIYPDTIETGGTKHADKIKTHHNRIPEIQKMIEQGLVIEPISQLYKDEVREVGEKLGLPADLVWRHPFPGPGLAVRCLCAEEEHYPEEGIYPGRLSLKEYLSSEILIGHYRYDFDVLPIRSVGVQGDVRSYKNPLVLSSGNKNMDILGLVSTNITNFTPAINRVLYLLYPEKIDSITLQKSYLTPSRISVLQDADKIVMDFIKEKKIDREIWQFPTVLLPLSINGASGETIVLRPVESEEAMTANFYKMDFALLDELVEKLKLVKGVSAVLYDITNKPPATIEWE
ncbi:MAG: GMP synthase, GMP synthase (glutamine-hydrolysing) [Candidatus Peregrinibacteria bacterium GW2011_GWC2_39_14]|nr:MAG: Bifunctional GMP synthase/glutamine amidotransferase protein [Candidatus Peregrinibacteria bacterium GW2011_GWA2_38_36]KKR07228.1 MAG: GMP synthase, GMP synthase (glutamine-hydrolysing) [Candidatus Peregrinibacteria bacterium GW2011_GWC2_39_14]